MPAGFTNWWGVWRASGRTATNWKAKAINQILNCGPPQKCFKTDPTVRQKKDGDQNGHRIFLHEAGTVPMYPGI
jgi:hypothetical protein